ncbi:pannexin-3-like [Arapaima gigas]
MFPGALKAPANPASAFSSSPFLHRTEILQEAAARGGTFQKAGTMSIANTAAQAMLSDALLRDGWTDRGIRSLELELPLDKVIKFVSVGLPLLLVSMAFAREITIG